MEENLNLSERRMVIGNIFKTQEEAEKRIDYLKAKTILKQDTKGFKPNWQDEDEYKYSAYWNINRSEPDYDTTISERGARIFFRNQKQIEESFKKHPEEWKTYLTYEQ